MSHPSESDPKGGPKGRSVTLRPPSRDASPPTPLTRRIANLEADSVGTSSSDASESFLWSAAGDTSPQEDFGGAAREDSGTVGAPPIDTHGTPKPSMIARRKNTASRTGLESPDSSLYGSYAENEGMARASRDENAADPLIGLVLAERYRIVEHLGRGGMGIVYRVEHVSIGKSLAMKLLAGELSTNKEIVRRFKQEALTVSQLSSPYTVQVFDYGHWQHLTFLVMELIEGFDLSRTLRRHGPIPFARLGKWMVHVCTSLVEAHAKGIVHRDIKPENIMLVVDESGTETAKVLDFGLAKLRESPELNEVTLQGSVVGTPYYMSPEQILGEDVDGRTDIYSLGAVMYRTLTGSFPFTATTPMAMFSKHLTEPPPNIERTHPELDIPKGISDAVQRCMSKKREERFQSVEALRTVLLTELHALGLVSSHSVLDVESEKHTKRPAHGRRPLAPGGADEPVATRKELEAYETQLRRNRYGAWALGGMLLAGTMGAVGWLGLRPTPSFTGVEMEPNNDAGHPNELPLGASIRGTLGKRLDEKTGDHDVYRVSVPGAGTQTIALQLDSLPNFGLCTSLYRIGYEQPTAHYCSGPNGNQALGVPQLRLDAADYLVVIHQDRSPAPGSMLAPPVYENISDHYRLTIKAQTEAGTDVEPNDELDAPQLMELADERAGSLGFSEDVDVFCSAKPGVHWVVDDGARRFGSVLEVTPFVDGSAFPLARVHGSKAQAHSSRTRMPADVNGPWTSGDCFATKCCIQLRLTRDPWAEGDASGPLPDDTRYRLELHPAN